MFRSFLAVAVVAGFVVAADEKKDDKAVLNGSWTKEGDGHTLEVKFPKAAELVVVVTAGDNGVTVNCKYTQEKDGTVKATVKSTVEKGSFPQVPKDGAEFSFKIKIDGKTAKLRDFESKDLEGAKDVMEGEYTSKEK